MAFSDLFFLFRFLPVFLIIYYAVPAGYRMLVLLAGSLFFYGYGDLRHIFLLIVSMGVNIALAGWMYRKRETVEGKGDRRILFLILALDAGLLAGFKAWNAFEPGSPLPLGLSFYTFKMISFQIDLYRGVMQKKPRVLETAVYFTLFPQIASGPIMRYRSGLIAGLKREGRWMSLEQGLGWFAIGLATKVLLADRLDILWKDIQGIGFESISTALAWLGAFGYSMYLYFDFWGYSLMAAGIGIMLGLPWIQNFDAPYASRSVGEFWRRWHMTLGSFFRDYLYIPLGGSRGGEVKTMRNLLIVWLVTGIWHGGSRNFLLWGLMLFLLIMIERLWLGKVFTKIPVLGHLWVLAVIPITWIFFAITDLEQLIVYLGRMFPVIGGEGIAVNPRDIWKYLELYGKYLAAGVIWCIPAVFRFYETHRRNLLILILTAVLFWISVYCIVSMGNNPFVYLMF